MFSDFLKEYSIKKFKERKAEYAGILQDLEQRMASCTKDERLLMQFFYGTMPLSDAGEYDFDTFLGFVRHGLMLRSEVPWCRSLPEDVFVKQVLYYRINSEKIENCRPFFYEQVRERIRGLSMEEAVLEINYWAAEHVSYRASDERTLSPLTVYRSGDGRCGEESAFLVSVLRSAGIPSRQVYVPVWAHCDDNHAWVEVMLPDGWHYLGACEPEEVLDRGWFDGAASRGMLIHAREFSDFHLPVRNPRLLQADGTESLGRENGVYFINRTDAYAETAVLSVCVLNDRNQPVAYTEVCFSIVNYAEYCMLAVLRTGTDGTVRLRLGRGSVQISTYGLGKYAEQKIDIDRDTAVVLHLVDNAPDTAETPVWEKYYFKAPAEKVLYARKPTAEQLAVQQCRMEECTVLRDRYLQEQEDAEGSSDAFHRMVLDTLSEKDRKDVTEEIFEDARLAENEGYPVEIYRTCVLSQRIGKEELTPFRRRIRSSFTEEQMALFRRNPLKIADYVRNIIAYDPDLDYPTLVSSPYATLRLRWGNEASVCILMTAVARTLQIAARPDPVTGAAEYYDRSSGEFRKFDEKPACTEKTAECGESGPGTGELRLHTEDGQLHFGQNWSISSWQPEYGAFQALRLADETGTEHTLQLPQGIYRILTSSREPGGNQHVEEITFMLKAGRTVSVHVKLDPLRTRDRIVHCRIEDFPAATPAGMKTTFLTGLSGMTLAVFADPGKEPTEHVLNEILDAAAARKDRMPGVVLLVRDAAQCGWKTISKAAALPKTRVLIAEDSLQSSRIARRLYADPDKLPLLMLMAGTEGDCIYGCSGYNVGSVALALEIADSCAGHS